MKFLSGIGASLVLSASLAAAAIVINDGTTTEGLIRLAPPPTSGTQATTLAVTPAENLLAHITQEFFDLPMHTAWYATAYVATGGTFNASAEYAPDTTAPYLDGGVLAWLNEATSRGLIFALRSTPTRTYCQVAVYDFTFGTPVSSLLFDTDGNEVDPGFNPPNVPESAMTPGYVAANPLRLQVSFEPPSTNDLQVVSNATARLTAVGIQNNGAGDQAVTTPIVLLTTLPEPVSGEKLTGYYAVYSNFLERDAPIGRLDNLTLDGEYGLGNQLPTITLTTPQAGEKFASGDPVDIAANATDSDGTIAQVEFFAGTESLSVATQAPYAYRWTSAAIGVHSLSAIATDNRGATRQSATVSIELTNRPPVVTLTSPAPGQVFPPGTSVLIEAEASDPDGSVTQVQFLLDGVLVSGSIVPPYTATWFAAQEGIFTLTAIAVDDRDASTVSAPVSVRIGQTSVDPAVMAVTISNGRINVTWDRLGFQLRHAPSLSGPWIDVAQDTTGVTQYSEPLPSQPKYFSLVARGVAPSGPTLAIEKSGSNLTLTWDQTGYQLQESADPATGWQDVGTATSGVRQYEVPSPNSRSFFRLRP